MAIIYRITVLDSTTNAPIVGAGIALVAAWGNNYNNVLRINNEAAGSASFSGTTDGNGQYQISLSDIGYQDSPYVVTGSARATNYYTTKWISRTINGNYNGKVINTVKYMTQNLSGSSTSPSPNNTTTAVNDIYGSIMNPVKSLQSSEPIIIWIIALMIIIAVVVLFFVLRGKFGSGPARPKAVIY